MSSKNKFFNLPDSDFRNLRLKLIKIAMIKTLNKFDAEDLVQTTILKALKNEESFSKSNNSNLDAWLITILKNSFIDQTRKKKEQLLGTDIPEIETEGEQGLSDAQRMLSICIEKLNQIDREIISMVKLGESYKFIAEVVDMSSDNIKKRVCLARKDLSLCLEG